MSDELQQLLERADGGPVGPPDLAAIERRSRRLRTAHIVGLTAAVVAGIAFVAVVVVTLDSARGPQVEIVGLPPAPTTTVVDGIVVDIAPSVSEIDRLERLDTVLPATMQLDADRALPLSRAPVDRAIALARKLDRRGGEETVVFVIGDDGRPRVIDLANLRLAGDVDPEVIRNVEALSTTLSPDGARAAFVHRDEQVADGVLVIDLASAEARRYPIADPLGFHSRVIWHPDGRALVIEDHELEQTLLLDLTTGEVDVQPHDDPAGVYGGLGVVATRTPDRDIVRLSGLPEKEPALSRWTRDGQLDTRHVLPATSLAPDGWDWGTPGWRHGDLVARTQRAGPPPENGVVVVIIDLASGEIVRALQLGGYKVYPSGRTVTVRGVDASPVLGWLDDETVLVADAGVVAWNIRTGRLYLVSQLEEGPGGASIGYDAIGDLRR